MRIDKLLSNLKYGTRKDVKKMIAIGKVRVNHQVVSTQDFEVDPTSDFITIDEKAIFYKKNIYLAFYKPKGYLSANHDNLHPVLFTFIKEPYNRFDLKVAGRLDIDSEGLMILTNDGNFIHQVTHPKYHVKKVYEVVLDKVLKQQDLEMLLKGVKIKDGKGEVYEAKALALICENKSCSITIDEGKFHQVKRMFKSLDYEVNILKRVQIGPLLLKDIKSGHYEPFESEIFYD